MSESTQAIFTAEELDDIYRARVLRTNIISSITADAKFIEDKDKVDIVLKAADGLDKSVFSRAKLRISSKEAATNQAQVAALIATMNMNNLSPCVIAPTDKNKANTFVITDLKPGEDVLGKVVIDAQEVTKQNI